MNTFQTEELKIVRSEIIRALARVERLIHEASEGVELNGHSDIEGPPLKDIVSEAIHTDGGHHKQWYLTVKGAEMNGDNQTAETDRPQRGAQEEPEL